MSDNDFGPGVNSDNTAIYGGQTAGNLKLPERRESGNKFREVDTAVPAQLDVLKNPGLAARQVGVLQEIGLPAESTKTALYRNIANQAASEADAAKAERVKSYEEGRNLTAFAEGAVEGVFRVVTTPVRLVGEALEPAARAYSGYGAGKYYAGRNDAETKMVETQVQGAENVANINGQYSVQTATVTGQFGVQSAQIAADGSVKVATINGEATVKSMEIYGEALVNKGADTIITNNLTNTSTNSNTALGGAGGAGGAGGNASNNNTNSATGGSNTNTNRADAANTNTNRADGGNATGGASTATGGASTATGGASNATGGASNATGTGGSSSSTATGTGTGTGGSSTSTATGNGGLAVNTNGQIPNTD